MNLIKSCVSAGFSWCWERGRCCLITARWWQKFSSASWAPSIPGVRALLSTLWQGWCLQLPLWCPPTPEQGCSCHPWEMVNIAIFHQTSSHPPQGDSEGCHAAFPEVHAVATDRRLGGAGSLDTTQGWKSWLPAWPPLTPLVRASDTSWQPCEGGGPGSPLVWGWRHSLFCVWLEGSTYYLKVSVFMGCPSPGPLTSGPRFC